MIKEIEMKWRERKVHKVRMGNRWCRLHNFLPLVSLHGNNFSSFSFGLLPKIKIHAYLPSNKQKILYTTISMCSLTLYNFYNKNVYLKNVSEDLLD